MWEQYQANQAHLHANAVKYYHAADSSPGAAREGTALLQGIAVCGQCGHRCQVDYKHARQYTYQLHALEQEIAGYRVRVTPPAAITPEL
jgi:hypothetical protein